MRIVVDANVWVSAVLTPDGPPGRVIRALGEDRFDLVTSEPIIREVADVLARRRIVVKYGISAEHIDRVVASIRERGELVPVTGSLHLCRDPDHDLVLETALTGEADALVSRDADLTRDPELITALRERGVQVLTVQHFLATLQARGTQGV
jgi:uncharacterized protein